MIRTAFKDSPGGPGGGGGGGSAASDLQVRVALLRGRSVERAGPRARAPALSAASLTRAPLSLARAMPPALTRLAAQSALGLAGASPLELRHRNVAKLLYLSIMGYATHWGQVRAAPRCGADRAGTA